MKELIARLELDMGGNREMDHAIASAVGHMKQIKDDVIYDPPYPTGQPRCQPLRYTTSLDAALTLRPPGHRLRIWEHHTGSFGCDFFPAGGGPLSKAHAASLALAVCIAALKAREQVTQQHKENEHG